MPRNVIILRALQLGDLLCAVPALRAMRQAWPHARLVLVGLPWARSFVERFRMYLDDFREFPGYPGLPERLPDLRRIPAFLQTIQDERYDLAVQLHGSGSVVNELTTLFNATRTASFYEPGGYCPDAELAVEWPTQGLESDRLLQLTERIGEPSRGAELEFPLNDADDQRFARLEGVERLRSGRYVVIHPGASVAPRRWPVDRFVSVATRLHEEGLSVALTGTAAEVGLTAPIAAAVPHALDLAGKTDLGSLGVLLAGARLLVANDTGVSHVAAGLKTPSVIISTGVSPLRWSPADRRRHRVLADDRGVRSDDVLAQAFDLLKTYESSSKERVSWR